METIVAEQDVNNGQTEIDGSSGISVVHVSIPNQPVQVQSVIQASPSVIQATGQGLQTIQVAVSSDDEETGGRKRREILARRPSYRKILNELSSDAPVISVQKIEEESNSSQASQESQEASDAAQNLTVSQGNTVQIQNADGTSAFAVVPAGALQLSGNSDINTTQGLQTITMSNVTSVNTPTSGATIVQYAQGPDGQFYIPAGNVQAYQITTPSLPQGVVMTTSGSAIASPQQLTEEAARKRELRLLKNREAAKECRRKKKDYVKCLENRVAVLENQNKALIEELKSLKELYCQKDVIGQ